MSLITKTTILRTNNPVCSILSGIVSAQLSKRCFYHNYSAGTMAISSKPRDLIAKESFGHMNNINVKLFKNNYSQQGYYIPPPPKKTYKKWYFLGIVVAAVVAFKIITFHRFPPSVAKLLRKALWAEAEGENQDHQLALRYYLEALEEADKMEMIPISDEYTGIQLKVAEMYEHLQMNDKAIMLYMEIQSAYLTCLLNNEVPITRRPHILQKDLRVAVKLCELLVDDQTRVKSLLLTHAFFASKEILIQKGLEDGIKDEESESIFNDDWRLFKQHLQNAGKDQQEKDLAHHISEDNLPLRLTEENKNNKDILKAKHASIFQPFRDELFNLRDLLVTSLLSTGDISAAVNTKLVSTKWMIYAECDPGDILMSQCNLASLFYLESEEFQFREVEAMKTSDVEAAKKATENRMYSLYLAKACYDSVIFFSKKLPSSVRRNGAGTNIDEATALATYGLGVIHFNLGFFDKAKQLLRESRLRAKGSEFEELVDIAENELNRIDKAISGELPDSPKAIGGDIDINIYLKKNTRPIKGIHEDI